MLQGSSTQYMTQKQPVAREATQPTRPQPDCAVSSSSHSIVPPEALPDKQVVKLSVVADVVLMGQGPFNI